MLNNSTIRHEWSFFVQPSICIFGLITNSLNIIVFLNKKMKDPSFKYMLFISISDLAYLSLLIFTPFIQNLNRNQADLYKIYIHDYLTSCLSMFSLLCELELSIQRYFILTNVNLNINANLLIFILIIISLLYYLPILINQVNNTLIFICLYLIRVVLGTIITVLNLVNLFKFKQRFKSTNEIRLSFRLNCNSNMHRKQNNITLMTFWIWIVYFLGTMSYSIMYYIKLMHSNDENHDNNERIEFILKLTECCLLISHSLNIFIYYFFNNMYRNVLKMYFFSK